MLNVFTDGGCRGNDKSKDNIGGAAFVIFDPENQEETIRVGKYGCKNTTNNVMELTAVKMALAVLTEDGKTLQEIVIHCDSNYVIESLTNWIYKWQRNGWRTSAKKAVENRELIESIDKLRNTFTRLRFVKVKGHSGNKYNELADDLVNEAMDEMI